MKIVVISNIYPSKSRSSGIWVKTIVEEIVRSGNDVDTLVMKGVPGNPLIKGWLYLVFYLRLFFTSYKKYDLIYMHLPPFCLIPFLVRGIPKNKLVVHIHGVELDVEQRNKNFFITKLIVFLTRLACFRAIRIIVPSHAFELRLQRKYPELTTKIYVSPSGGIDTDLFYFCDHADLDGSGPLNLCSVGNLIHLKSHDTTIRAISRLRFPVKLTIVGSGPLKDSLHTLVRQLNLDSSVHFIDHIHNRNLPEFYGKCDVFVFASKSESLGVVSLESFSCGTPVIGSNIDAIREYVRDGYNGFLFHCGDEQDLADKLSAYRNLSLETKLQMRKNARETAMKYDHRVVIKDLLELFTRLVKHNDAGSR